MSTKGMGPCMAVEGSTTREVFEAYVERVLCPSLSKGQVVVMDNLTAHKGERGLRNSSSSEVVSCSTWNYVGLVDTYRLGADIAPERSPLHAENQATISPGIQG